MQSMPPSPQTPCSVSWNRSITELVVTCFAIIYEAKTGKLYGLNASGWAPKAETVELLALKGITKMPPSGVWSATVPGAVAGWWR